MLQGPLYQMLCLLGSAFALGGCGRAIAPQESAIEWHRVPWTQGTLNVALVRPESDGSGPHPVIFALPWGSGDAQLVESFIRSYWLTEPTARGYYVIAPEVRGSSLADTAGEVIPAIFQWMEETLSFDADRVALVGASNGGRGIFFAALSQPDRFRALIGLPGQYSGDPANLAVLVGKPIWLIVGETDDSWVAGTDATVSALASHGITAEVLVAPGQGHVMSLDPRRLLDWIDEALQSQSPPVSNLFKLR